MNKIVTEESFRKSEYKLAKVEDYEFRDDGELVRKDRWETAIRSIANALKIDTRNFEIVEVLRAVDELIRKSK